MAKKVLYVGILLVFHGFLFYLGPHGTFRPVAASSPLYWYAPFPFFHSAKVGSSCSLLSICSDLKDDIGHEFMAHFNIPGILINLLFVGCFIKKLFKANSKVFKIYLLYAVSFSVISSVLEIINLSLDKLWF